MQKALDTLLSWLKWPFAFVAIFFLPGLLFAWSQAILVSDRINVLLPVVAGLLGYGLLWGLIFRRRQAGSFLPTFFHELTHGLVAIMTFHRVGGLRASWSSGGRLTIYGGTNWLILVAPYFFPLVPLLGALFVLFGPEEWELASLCGFGVTVSFHVFSLASDIHFKQTDLQTVGFAFAGLFLPSANLFTLGALIATTLGGADGFSDFLEHSYQGTHQWLSLMIE